MYKVIEKLYEAQSVKWELMLDNVYYFSNSISVRLMFVLTPGAHIGVTIALVLVLLFMVRTYIHFETS